MGKDQIGESKEADDLLNYFLKQFEDKFPGNTIGKIEIWNRFGFIAWKRKQTRREWQRQQEGKNEMSLGDIIRAAKKQSK